MGKAPGPKRGAPAPPQTRRCHSIVEDPRMGRVRTWGIQSLVLYLSDAFGTDACAPVHPWNIFTFGYMLEIGFISAVGVRQNVPVGTFCLGRMFHLEHSASGWVRTWGIQRLVLYLSDAFDTDACAPVHPWDIFTFWSMSEMGIRSRGRVRQNRIK